MKLNPQIETEITNCVSALRKGEFIFFPDETGWSIGCDAMNEKLIQKIISLDDYDDGSVLLNDPGRLNKFVKEIPDTLWDLIEFSERPLQVLLGGVVNLPASLISESQESAFRIVKEVFPKLMVHKFGKPVFSAKCIEQSRPSVTADGILNTPAYVVNLRIGAKSNTGSLVIIRLSGGGRIEVVRK